MQNAGVFGIFIVTVKVKYHSLDSLFLARVAVVVVVVGF